VLVISASCILRYEGPTHRRGLIAGDRGRRRVASRGRGISIGSRLTRLCFGTRRSRYQQAPTDDVRIRRKHTQEASDTHVGALAGFPRAVANRPRCSADIAMETGIRTALNTRCRRPSAPHGDRRTSNNLKAMAGRHIRSMRAGDTSVDDELGTCAVGRFVGRKIKHQIRHLGGVGNTFDRLACGACRSSRRRMREARARQRDRTNRSTQSVTRIRRRSRRLGRLRRSSRRR